MLVRQLSPFGAVSVLRGTETLGHGTKTLSVGLARTEHSPAVVGFSHAVGVSLLAVAPEKPSAHCLPAMPWAHWHFKLHFLEGRLKLWIC